MVSNDANCKIGVRLIWVLYCDIILRKMSAKREEIMKVIFSLQTPDSRLRFASGVHVWDVHLGCARLGHVVMEYIHRSWRLLSLITIVHFEGWWSNIFLCGMWFPWCNHDVTIVHYIKIDTSIQRTGVQGWSYWMIIVYCCTECLTDSTCFPFFQIVPKGQAVFIREFCIQDVQVFQGLITQIFVTQLGCGPWRD